MRVGGVPFCCLLVAVGCQGSGATTPGPLLLSVQRLDPQPARPGAAIATMVPGAIADAAKLGYAVGIPSGSETILAFTIGAAAKAAPMQSL